MLVIRDLRRAKRYREWSMGLCGTREELREIPKSKSRPSASLCASVPPRFAHQLRDARCCSARLMQTKGDDYVECNTEVFRKSAPRLPRSSSRLRRAPPAPRPAPTQGLVAAKQGARRSSFRRPCRAAGPTKGYGRFSPRRRAKSCAAPSAGPGPLRSRRLCVITGTIGARR